MRHELKFAALAAILSITVVGCASNPDSTASLTSDAEKSQTSSDINSIRESIEQADATVAKAKSDELDWFATQYMQEATKALTEAKDYYKEFALNPSEANSSSGFFSSKTNLEAAQIAIASFKTNIEKAQSIRANAMTTLESAFDYKAQLTKIGADKYYPNTIKELDRELKKLVDYIADNNVNSAISAQPELLIKQRALEVKTVTKIYLFDAQQQLSRLQQALIGNDAPNTLAQAAAAVTAAEAFINAEPRAIDKIKQKAAAATFALNHAEQVSTAVRQLRALPSSAYENYIVNTENLLLNISNTLGSADHRDQPLNQQGKAIVTFIENDMQNEQASEQQKQALRDQVKQQNGLLDAQATQIDVLQSKLIKQTDYATSLESKISELLAKTNSVENKETMAPTQKTPSQTKEETNTSAQNLNKSPKEIPITIPEKTIDTDTTASPTEPVSTN